MSRRVYGGDDLSVAGDDMSPHDSERSEECSERVEDPWLEEEAASFTKEQMESKLAKYCKQELSQFDLVSILSQLRRRELPTQEVALRLVAQVYVLLRDTGKSLLELPKPMPQGRMIIVGDLHGHLADLWHVYTHMGMPSERNQYLFNGDFVDRGVWGPEVVLMIFTLKMLWPKNVFLNRGNHETKRCTAVYGFRDHLSVAYPEVQEELYELIHQAFDMLPLCHTIGNTVCIMHGGLPKEPCYLEDIRKLRRGPMPFPGDKQADFLFQALLWSDPMRKEGLSDRGLGWHFSKRNTERFLFLNGLSSIIRSHQCVDHGYQVTHTGLVTTVFSSSNYDESNNANIAIINSSLQVSKGMKFGWNEVYLKPEWLLQVGKPQFDVVVLGDSEGYLDYTVGIHRQEGEKLGIELSMDHPILEIPVVTSLHDQGCIIRYNAMNPDIPVEIGDAVLEVNGSCGYTDIKEAFKSSAGGSHRTGLYIRFRRPERLDVSMDREREGNPDVGNLGFPDNNNFLVAPQGWGSKVHRYDRIVEVNEQTERIFMSQQLLQAPVLNILLLRYAPWHLELYPPETTSPSLMRQASQSGYEDRGQEQRAIDALRSRLGNLERKEVGSVRRRVQEDLRRTIWLNRPRLLENFTDMDRMDTPRRPSLTNLGTMVSDWGGSLPPVRWAEVMHKTLRTPEGFPWLDLLPHIYRPVSAEERVPYVRFLMRYHNRVSRWLVSKWSNCALDRIMHSLDCTPEEQFKRLDVEGIGKVSYNQLRYFFQRMVFPHEASTKTEKRTQETRMFALFLQMESADDSFNGSVLLKDYVEILMKRKVATARLCPDGHQLTHGRLASCNGIGEVRMCDDCGVELPLTVERRWCPQCEFDLCIDCATKREIQDTHHLKESMEEEVTVSAQWHDVEKVVHLLCSAGVNCELLFGGVDHNTDTIVDQARFISVVSEMLGGEDGEATKAAETFHSTIRDFLATQPGTQPQGDFKLKDLVECLYIQEEDRVL